jgi:hypothetical protein
MSAGAMTAAPRVCRVPGCTRSWIARGMCPTHWKQWSKRTTVRQEATTLQTVEDCLPAHLNEIVAQSGLAPQTVKFTLDKLHKLGRARIGSYLAPTSQGTNWHAVWAPGKGSHVKLTEEMRREHRRERNRISHALRRAKSIGWASQLMVSQIGRKGNADHTN